VVVVWEDCSCGGAGVHRMLCVPTFCGTYSVDCCIRGRACWIEAPATC